MIPTRGIGRRLGPWLIALLALALMLTSCGAAQVTPAPATTADAAAPVAATAPAEAAITGKIQIAVVAGAMLETMKSLAKDFEAAHPGTTVEVINEPEGGAFEALIAAGNQPDLITGSFGYMPAKYAAINALVPLEDLPGATELFARLDPKTVNQDFGHNFYVPLGVDVTAMIYNKDLFKEAGLDPENPPQTWPEFLAAAEKIQALPPRADGSKVYGTVFWNEALAFGGWYWNMLQPLYLNGNQNTCEMVNRLGTDIVFDKPECKMDAFFTFVTQAQKYAPPTMEKNFFSRSIGMWSQYGYSWEPNLQTAKDTPMAIGVDVGIAPVPVPEAGQTSYTTLGGRPMMLMKTTPARQATAWAFMQFMMEDANNLQFIKELGYLPAITTLQSDPYFAEPARKPFVDMLKTAVYPQALANFDAAVTAVLGVYQETVIQGAHTPEEVAALAATRARAALKK
ncbi:extracellular solute-binding protein [Oscillochloris sp. ZM17-4]|uniref:extracellular solute-binding protein n=1 Tax=Oscillochloris sp. ZM17-4 TaxID=2866714 RepID=UPI001C72D8E8|nr:extracellular solute-binding protein [Oscillochloris sp. ZM17-4]MBX0328339.1 extracellular solute-binding protein [Oscillochloris sp. ZM17-4]